MTAEPTSEEIAAAVPVNGKAKRQPEELERASNLYCAHSERAFVGCVISSKGSVLETCPATQEHFFDGLAGQVFGHAMELHKNGRPVNTRTIMRHFHEAPMQRVNQIADICFYPAPSEATHFWEIINDKLALRRAQDSLQWAVGELLVTQDVKGYCADLQRRVASLETSSESENVFFPVCDKITEKLDRMERGDIIRGIDMKLSPFEQFGGLLPGQLYAIAGRPATGKTALFEWMIQQCLEVEAPVCVFEKDMSPEKLIARMACRASGIQFWRYARGTMHGHECRRIKVAIQEFRKFPIHLYNPVGMTADQMCQIARRDVRVHGVKAVFLDHIQALNVGSELRVGLTQASLRIRRNTTETDVPHVVLAHINRNGAKGRPSPQDIKEFDQLYGDCDGMMILWNDEVRAEMGQDEMMTTKFYIAKNRDGGISEAEMLFEGSTMTFKEKARV